VNVTAVMKIVSPDLSNRKSFDIDLPIAVLECHLKASLKWYYQKVNYFLYILKNLLMHVRFQVGQNPKRSGVILPIILLSIARMLGRTAKVHLS